MYRTSMCTNSSYAWYMTLAQSMKSTHLIDCSRATSIFKQDPPNNMPWHFGWNDEIDGANNIICAMRVGFTSWRSFESALVDELCEGRSFAWGSGLKTLAALLRFDSHLWSASYVLKLSSAVVKSTFQYNAFSVLVSRFLWIWRPRRRILVGG